MAGMSTVVLPASIWGAYCACCLPTIDCQSSQIAIALPAVVPLWKVINQPPRWLTKRAERPVFLGFLAFLHLSVIYPLIRCLELVPVFGGSHATQTQATK